MQLLRFNIKPNSLIQYWLTANQETLYIDVVDGKDAPLGFAVEYDKIFHIRKFYTAYLDEVEEILWKSRIYNASYKKQVTTII